MILLDTHTVLWLAEAPELLSSRAVEAIKLARARDGLAIADTTLWELATLIERGRVQVATSTLQFLGAVEQNITVLPITPAIALRATRFVLPYPRDPADSLIGATAVELGLKLVTKDKLIRASGQVATIW